MCARIIDAAANLGLDMDSFLAAVDARNRSRRTIEQFLEQPVPFQVCLAPANRVTDTLATCREESRRGSTSLTWPWSREADLWRCLQACSAGRVHLEPGSAPSGYVGLGVEPGVAGTLVAVGGTTVVGTTVGMGVLVGGIGVRVGVGVGAGVAVTMTGVSLGLAVWLGTALGDGVAEATVGDTVLVGVVVARSPPPTIPRPRPVWVASNQASAQPRQTRARPPRTPSMIVRVRAARGAGATGTAAIAPS
jgi:hypothetical protein